VGEVRVIDIPRGVIRVSRRWLQTGIVGCDTYACVYQMAAGAGQGAAGRCSDPQTAKGNYDAKCHRESNRALLARLEDLRPWLKKENP
jgi:hypothetical protein